MPRDHRLYLDDIVQTKLDPLRTACRNALAEYQENRGSKPPIDLST